jgi:DNA-binding transcriptional LysR family regulator
MQHSTTRRCSSTGWRSVSNGTTLARQPTRSTSTNLRFDPWVTPYDCVCRTAVELACRQAGFAPRVVSESNDYMAIQGLVAAGVGVAIVPRIVRAMVLRPEVILRPITGTDITRVVAITSRAGRYASPASEAMRAALHAAIDAIDDSLLPLDRARASPAADRDSRRTDRPRAASRRRAAAL